MADWSTLAGYTDRLSARPGERLRLMVSAADAVSAEIVRLPGGEAAAEVALEPVAEPRLEAVRSGSYVEVPGDPAWRPRGGFAVRTWVWLAPGADSPRRQALISSWDEGGNDGFALTLGHGALPGFTVAGDGRVCSVSLSAPLTRGAWVLLEGRLDPAQGRLTLARIAPDGVAIESHEATCDLASIGASTGPVLIGAERRGKRPEGDHFDGKLDGPALLSVDGDAFEPIARWDLGAGRGSAVIDRGPRGCNGRAHNGPLRAVTGHNWSGQIHDWRFAEGEYGAMHFHSDAVDDLGWPVCFEIAVAAECPSGAYAVKLASAGASDTVPFFVCRADSSAAQNTVLLPTFTYLAYSCEREAPRAAASERGEDRWVAEHGLRSLYDRYDDGVGVYEASLLRPLTQIRPDYPAPQHGGPHCFAQDLILLGFLERNAIEYDLITDHDLDRDGKAALDGARTLITGAHPEYASTPMLDAIDAHLKRGGHLVYLGGNGLNGSVSVDPERPQVLELRRTETNGLAWQALAGEHHHAATGDPGDDWRRRSRAEHATLGVGLCAFGEDEAGSYERVAPADDPVAAVVFAGLDPARPIGADGVVLGGAAGFEVDCSDPALGSPPDTQVLARSPELESYDTWEDDTVARPDGEPAPRRAEITIRLADSGSVVFSVGSIAWSGCLGDDDNSVARATRNLLAELAKEQPFAEARGG